MKYRYLGNSGLAVSVVCLGTATFGQKQWGCDNNTAHQILNRYSEHGGNFIDTADQYGDKNSEQIIGNWLKSRNRDKYIVASKCFFKTNEDINSRGLSRKHIIKACESSLKRLNTDYLDLYQIHNPDPQTPLEETLNALDYLMKQGKIRYIGCSNHPAWKNIKAFYISKINNYQTFISGQYLYNLLKRDIEIEIIPSSMEIGMKIICWSPLSGGMLTGKYTDAKIPAEGSRMALRTDLSENRYHNWYEKSLPIISKLQEIANNNNQSPSVVALSWILYNKNIASVIVGANSPDQITENCKAGDWVLKNDDYEKLTQISKINYQYPFDVIKKTNAGWYNDIL